MMVEPRMDLKRARHFLLGLTLPGVVASDLGTEAARAVVLSGPNAGGKTVALKTLGAVKSPLAHLKPPPA